MSKGKSLPPKSQPKPSAPAGKGTDGKLTGQVPSNQNPPPPPPKKN